MISKKNIKYSINKSSKNDIYSHLIECSNNFIPPLDKYVNIDEYSDKIYNKSVRFEAFCNNKLIGLIALYCNIKKNIGFITNISVNSNFFNSDISIIILDNCKKYMLKNNYNYISLEVNKNNARAIRFYKKNKFIHTSSKKSNLIMKLKLQRDYDKENMDTKNHKYIYDFDINVMHQYILRSFIPFFIKGNLLELGSFRGDFTRRLLPYFDDITCVDASGESIQIAKQKLGNKVKYINELIEKVSLIKKYNNIILIHVLEHIDKPVDMLKRINDEWLSDNGRFFLVCPNANAPSRQIAVKMGLIHLIH